MEAVLSRPQCVKGSIDEEWVFLGDDMALNVAQDTRRHDLTHLPWRNGRHFVRRHFLLHFSEWKWQNSNFTEICLQELNWQASIGSCNGLELNMRLRQTSTWTNYDPVHCGTGGGGGGGGGGGVRGVCVCVWGGGGGGGWLRCWC